MKVRRALGVFALVMYWMTTGMHAQQQQTDLSKPKVPLVSVVGCATQMSDGTWMLTKATDGVESKVLFMSAKEIEEAKTKPLGNNQYKLLGTVDFLTKEDLLNDPHRAETTRPQDAKATGKPQNTRNQQTNGIPTTAPNEK